MLHRLLKDADTRGALIALALIGFGAVLAFVMFSLIARALGPVEFGTFATWFNIASFLAVVGAAGQETLIARNWPEFAGRDEAGLVKGAVKFGIRHVMIATAVILSGLVITCEILGIDRRITAAAGFIVLLQPVMSFCYQLTRAHLGHIRSDAIYECVLRLMVVFSILVCIGLGWQISSPFALAIIGIADVVTFAIILAVMLPSLSSAFWTALPEERTSEWRKRSIGMWSAAILEAFSQYVDVVLVHLMLGEVAAGAYFAASRIANIFAKVTLAIETRAATKLSLYYHQNKVGEITTLMRGLSKASLLVVVVGFPATLLAANLVLPVFGEVYRSEFLTVGILIVGTALITLMGPARLMLLHTGHEAVYTTTLAAGLAVRAVLFAVLGPMFGTAGIAAAWTIATTGTGIAQLLTCWRKIGIDPSVRTLFTSDALPPPAEEITS